MFQHIPKETLLGELFAIFYVDDGYIASRDPDFLQKALDMLVDIFRRTGLETNTKKTQAMVCTPGKIRVQLSRTSYRRMREGNGGIGGDEWESRVVVCRKCGKAMKIGAYANTSRASTTYMKVRSWRSTALIGQRGSNTRRSKGSGGREGRG